MKKLSDFLKEQGYADREGDLWREWASSIVADLEKKEKVSYKTFLKYKIGDEELMNEYGKYKEIVGAIAKLKEMFEL